MGFILIIALLTACSPIAAVTTHPTSAPQSTDISVPPPTSAPTFTPEVYVVDQIVAAYMNGETVSVVELSADQQEAFANKLAEQLNEARGARPLVYNNEAYVDPITGMMKDYDGHPDLEETIQTFYPATLDSEGNLYITTPDGKQKIDGSQGVDWNMVVTEPGDERINWPTGEKDSAGFSRPGNSLRVGTQIIPMIMLDTRVDQLYLTGKSPGIVPTITLLDIITDVNGIPILARKVIAHSTGQFALYEEGSDYCVWQNTLDSLWYGFSETKKQIFFTSLEPNQAYYIVFGPNQSQTYVGILDSPDDDYENIVATDDVVSVLMGQQSDNINTVIFNIQSLIKIKN